MNLDDMKLITILLCFPFLLTGVCIYQINHYLSFIQDNVKEKKSTNISITVMYKFNE